MKNRIYLVAFIFASFLLLSSESEAKRKFSEKTYQEKWCKEARGRTEVVMNDGTRCDCLTDTHAIEFDFSNKWAEAIGQSLNYSLFSKKKAGIVLIIEDDSDYEYVERIFLIIHEFNLPIDLWVTEE